MQTRIASLVTAFTFALGLTALSGCDSVDKKPEIVNTMISPANWKVSGIADEATFTLTVDVVHFEDPVASVSATVQGQNSLTFNLTKQSEVDNGERWTASPKITLWSGISKGMYHLDVTAADTQGRTVTKTRAVSVTITD